MMELFKLSNTDTGMLDPDIALGCEWPVRLIDVFAEMSNGGGGASV